MAQSIFIGQNFGNGASGDLTTNGGFIAAGDPGSWLSTSDSTVFTTPTVAQVLAEHPEIVFTWAALTDPSYGADVVVCTHGGSWVFCSEITSGKFTGASEPTWANANDPGETVVDGDITWVNNGLWSAFPPAVTTWTANHNYNPTLAVRIVEPTTPNGFLYLAYPVALTSGNTEPNFGSINFSQFIADNDGFWMNMGTSAGGPVSTTTRTTAWGPEQCTSAGGVCGDAVAGAVTIATGASSVTVATTAVTANSLIFVTENSALGTRLGVTCKTNSTHLFYVTTVTANTSFVITSNAASTSNPTCLQFFLLNPNA